MLPAGSSGNLTSAEDLKSPQITVTENTAISLCPLNKSVYRKLIQRICILEHLEHYQVYSLVPLLPAAPQVSFHNVSFFNY